MKKLRKIIFICVIIVVFVNLPFWDFFAAENYTYQNRDGSFSYIEEAQRAKSFWGCERLYGVFLCHHPEKDLGDNRLYRTFTIKPWRFWEWREMILHSDRFQLPYLDTTSRRQ